MMLNLPGTRPISADELKRRIEAMNMAQEHNKHPEPDTAVCANCDDGLVYKEKGIRTGPLTFGAPSRSAIVWRGWVHLTTGTEGCPRYVADPINIQKWKPKTAEDFLVEEE